MGCCCGVTYEEEVEAGIVGYLKTINKPDSTKNKLIKEIKDDLYKRASTVDRYYYPYRKEDVEKTVNFYKNYISIRLKGSIQLYDVQKKEVVKKEIKEEQTKKENKRLSKEEIVNKTEVQIKNQNDKNRTHLNKHNP